MNKYSFATPFYDYFYLDNFRNSLTRKYVFSVAGMPLYDTPLAEHVKSLKVRKLRTVS